MQIIIGDPHGCLRELQALLSKVGHRPGQDDLVFLGDFIDRGPDPVGVVDLAMRLGARRVMGNHEEKALRWLRHEAKVASRPGYKNPMRPPSPEKAAQWRALSEDHVRWLSESPLYLDLGGNWLAVHAGFEPGLPLKDQEQDHVSRVRFVKEEAKVLPEGSCVHEMVGYKEDSLDQPEGTVYWTQKWAGPQNVVYGHAVHSRRMPRVDTTHHLHNEVVHTVGIDTGCVFGGRLTAMVLDHPGAQPRFVQVGAEREYLPPPGPVPDEV